MIRHTMSGTRACSSALTHVGMLYGSASRKLPNELLQLELQLAAASGLQQ